MVEVKHRNSPDVLLLRVDQPNLDGADLSEAYLACAEMQGLRCRRASFRAANLREADLRHADLAGADFSEARLRRADLRNATLHAACLVRADLTGANLAGADLCGADLSHAILFDADLSAVRYDDETLWPEGAVYVIGPPAAPAPPPPFFVGWARGARARTEAWGRTGHRWARRHGVSVGALAAACAAAALVGGLAGAQFFPRTVAGPVQVVRQLSPPRLSAAPPVEVRPGRTRPARAHARLRPRPAPVRVAVREVPSRPSAAPRRHVRRDGIARAPQPHRSARRQWLAAVPRPPQRFRTRVAGARLAQRSTRHLVTARVSPPPRASRPPLILASYSSPQPPPAPAPRRRRARRRDFRRGMVQVAWGNPGFHYGSGYDIYRMHLTPSR